MMNIDQNMSVLGDTVDWENMDMYADYSIIGQKINNTETLSEMSWD